MIATLGASVGNQTSYQFWDENWAFGTPRGGRRTVPIRVPSFGSRGVPRRTTRTLMAVIVVPRADGGNGGGDGARSGSSVVAPKMCILLPWRTNISVDVTS